MCLISDENPTLTFKGAIFGRHHVDDDWTPVHVQDPDITHNRRLQCGVDKEYGVSKNFKLMDFFWCTVWQIVLFVQISSILFPLS